MDRKSYASFESDFPSSFIKLYGEIEVDPDAENSEDNFKAHLVFVEKKIGVYSDPKSVWIHHLALQCLRNGMRERGMH